MNLFQLILKQMRQRALSTWLTMLSVVLGVGLATAVLLLYRAGDSLFGQTEFGYDILMGPPKGSPLQLVLNTIYQVDQSPGVLSYSVYEDLMRNRQQIRIAVPIAVGDTYKGHRIVATLPKIFGYSEEGQPLAPEATIEYRPGKRYAIEQGKPFHARKFQAVIGAEIPPRTGLKIGDKFKVTHGGPEQATEADEHDEQWEVVGILKRTHTAADRVIYTPLSTFYAIGDHEKGMRQQAEIRIRLGLDPLPAPPATRPREVQDQDHDLPTTVAVTDADHDLPTTGAAAGSHGHAHHGHDHAYHMNPDGTLELEVPKHQWQLSAIMVKTRGVGGQQALAMIYHYKVIDPKAVAVNPATVMREFFDTFFKGTTMVLVLIALLVSIVASVGILVSIYNSVSARRREIAIIRALGATRGRVLTLVCLEAGLIGLLGGVLGLVLGHVVGALASVYMKRWIGEGINPLLVSRYEVLYLVGVVVLALVAGLVPALKAYKTPVATNLVAG
jgi:putative ABC transport system permease protein